MNEFRRWELFQQQLCVLLLLQLVVRCLHECVMTGGRAGVAHKLHKTATAHKLRIEGAHHHKNAHRTSSLSTCRGRAPEVQGASIQRKQTFPTFSSARVKRKEKREIHNQIPSQTPTKQNPTRFETIVKQKHRKKLIKLSSNEHVNLRIYRSCT